MSNKFVVWFNEVDKEDIDLVGGKGANLGEMTKAGFPVPPGFIVTSYAYYHFLKSAGIEDQIQLILASVDVNNSQSLERTAHQVQEIILKSVFPKQIATEIITAYFKLDQGIIDHARVAVRSSATAEDLPGASFAGQQSTYLNVWGEANLIEKVKEAWASLFTARAIFYRSTHHFDHLKVGIAIPVQKMVESVASGIMFTIDPVTNDKTKIVIEAIWGLGELIVQGEVTPDHYEVDKQTGKITAKRIQPQGHMLVQHGSSNAFMKVPESKAKKQKITDSQIQDIAKLGKKLEEHYYFPQDSEWAIENDKIFLVQTRPVTTIENHPSASSSLVLTETSKLALILKGDPASPGLGSGPVKKLSSGLEIGKIMTGDVLVAEMTNPDFVPAMKKAVAIVTERGGRTSHAAIVSRELGIPAVVGATGARKALKDGLVVTVNGSAGEVYKGAIRSRQPSAVSRQPKTNPKLKTATKVYVNIAEPSRANHVAKLNVDGVGLLRAEFMVAQIGTHPKKFIADGKQEVFVRELSKGIETICEAFHPRPVVYRATDFRTNEYRNLKGGDRFEPKEENPMLGFRGASRYIADPRVFELELEAIKWVRNKKGLKNLHLMIPFVRSPVELLNVKKIVAATGLTRSSAFHLWMMVELPTNVILIDKFLDVGIDGVSIGSNDLTMLTLGIDRDNSEVAHIFSEKDEAVLWSLERVIEHCAKRSVTTSICGQAPSDYPELVEQLVAWGITSISVNPDVVDTVRETISHAEEKLVQLKTKHL